MTFDKNKQTSNQGGDNKSNQRPGQPNQQPNQRPGQPNQGDNQGGKGGKDDSGKKGW